MPNTDNVTVSDIVKRTLSKLSYEDSSCKNSKTNFATLCNRLSDAGKVQPVHLSGNLHDQSWKKGSRAVVLNLATFNLIFKL